MRMKACLNALRPSVGRGMRWYVAGLTLLGALALGSAGCARSPSRVELGQTVTTGNGEYDAFFTQVLAARDEAMKAGKDAVEARASLVRALDLDRGAPADKAVQVAGESARKLREKGVLMHLELTPEVRLVSVRPPRPIDASTEALLKSVEETAKSSYALVRRLGELTKRTTELQKKRSELRDKAPAVFGERKDDVVRELNAAELVISDATEQSVDHGGQTSRFLIALTGAVETGAGAGVRVSQPAAPTGRPKGAPGKASPGGGTAQPPRKQKPKKSDDFEP